ncbi:MAG: hypothetical protein IPP94_03320 [Ignavibacteria bacterium]|nr:hypothetical protein [Ignavibacteria bacterium]
MIHDRLQCRHGYGEIVPGDGWLASLIQGHDPARQFRVAGVLIDVGQVARPVEFLEGKIAFVDGGDTVFILQSLGREDQMKARPIEKRIVLREIHIRHLRQTVEVHRCSRK